MSQTNYRVKGMMCGHCQKHVQDTLTKINGVEHVEVLLEEGKAKVQTANDSAPDFGEIQAAFSNSNYIIEQE